MTSPSKKLKKEKIVKAWISTCRGKVIEVLMTAPLQDVIRIPKFGEKGDVVIKHYPCVITYKS